MMRRAILMVAAVALSLLVASGIALAVNKVGTQGRDFLKGTDGADHLIGKGEDDRIFSLAGKDTLIGGPGKDWMWAGGIRASHQDPKVTYTSSGGEKKLIGGTGNDVLWGGKGSDNAEGQDGNDLLVGGEYHHPVKDTLSGGGGNDVFSVDNDPAGKDVVRCGGGFDWVFADRKDVVAADCEKVGDKVSELDGVYNSIPKSFWKSLPYPLGHQYPSKPSDYAKAQGLAKTFEKANLIPLVGDWRNNYTCDEVVKAEKQAGLADQIPSHKELVKERQFGAVDRSDQDSKGPCRGLHAPIPRDQIFHGDGRYALVNYMGFYDVEEGPFSLPNDHTLVYTPIGHESIPPITVHFRFSDHLNIVTFELVLPKNLDQCSQECREQYGYAVSGFGGKPWHRVCQGDHKDNNINGRTDELGERCWMDPVNGFDT
jgi:hypothetical protein